MGGEGEGEGEGEGRQQGREGDELFRERLLERALNHWRPGADIVLAK